LAKKPSHPPKDSSRHSRQPKPGPVEPPPPNNSTPIPAKGPQFGEAAPTPDPSKFTVKHGSDTQAYKILDSEAGTLKPRAFPVVPGKPEPVVKLADALGSQGTDIEADIQKAGQIVFHSVGDTGNTKGPRDMDAVVDKMVADFADTDPRSVPSFFLHLGDVVYSFGESQYYYDQFYDPYRNYPAPIFAIAGNHDGMVAPNSNATSLASFLENFCQVGKPFHRTPESGELARTAQIQPGVYYTLQAPFVRILCLYSNCLEDPGVISTQSGQFPYLTDAQLNFLTAALTRVKQEKYSGALLIALHHPPYVAVATVKTDNVGRHGTSPKVLEEIDAICAKVGVWPHAFLSGHAHNYQRFTRTQGKRQTPFLVVGNGGHAVNPLTQKGSPTLRTPMAQPSLSQARDTVVFENYDDQDFGYTRIVADPKQLRIEYHPASDTGAAKTPDDFVTVDLASHQLVHYTPPPNANE
jgi:Calcineurin-like phosphoesterase